MDINNEKVIIDNDTLQQILSGVEDIKKSNEEIKNANVEGGYIRYLNQ
jgi:hypothetical protein